MFVIKCSVGILVVILIFFFGTLLWSYVTCKRQKRLSALQTLQTLQMDTKEAILYCEKNKILGSYVECGVMEGKHPIIACNTVLQNNLDIIDIYMFDTYEGLTKPGKYDYSTKDALYEMNNKKVIEAWESQKTGKNTSKWCYCNLENVKKMYIKQIIQKINYILLKVML